MWSYDYCPGMGSTHVLDDLAREIGQQIRAERVAAGLTQAELADQSGVPFGTLRRIERSERPVGMGQLSLIARALGVKASEIVETAELRVLRGVPRHGKTRAGRRTPGDDRRVHARRTDDRDS